MTVGSRGLSDCVCSPSGSDTFEREPNCFARVAAGCSTTGVTSPRVVSHLSARPGARGTEDARGDQRTQRGLCFIAPGFNSGMAPGGSGSELGSTVPLTGGRSWYMKSHFHRSDGFEFWSQWRASSGRLNCEAWSSPRALATPGWRAAISLRTWAAVAVVERDAERDAEVHDDLPVLHGLAWRRRSRARWSADVPARWYRTPPSPRSMRPAGRNRRPATDPSAARPGR